MIITVLNMMTVKWLLFGSVYTCRCIARKCLFANSIRLHNCAVYPHAFSFIPVRHRSHRKYV